MVKEGLEMVYGICDEETQKEIDRIAKENNMTSLDVLEGVIGNIDFDE